MKPSVALIPREVAMGAGGRNINAQEARNSLMPTQDRLPAKRNLPSDSLSSGLGTFYTKPYVGKAICGQAQVTELSPLTNALISTCVGRILCTVSERSA